MTRLNVREKALVASLLLAVVLYFGLDGVTQILFGPVREREQVIAGLQRQVDEHDTAYAKVRHAQQKHKQWSQQSLPPDPSVASTVYQQWLLDLVQHAGWTDSVVNPNRVVPQGDVYFRIPFTIQGRCDWGQLCDFLCEYGRADLLQKVTQVSLDALDNDDEPMLDASVQVEALAVSRAAPRTTLGLRTSQPASRSARLRSEYDVLVDRNPFARGYRSSPVAPPLVTTPPLVRPAPAPPDTAGQIVLVACIRRSGQREAWLYDRIGKREVVLVEGESFQAAELTGSVVAIADDHVVLQVSGTARRLELGQNLRQLAPNGS